VTSSDWQPSASLEALRLRASLYQKIRHFFQQRDVLEVETPLLGRAASTDLHLASMAVQADNKFLQTSPEFAMKRLLASGSGAIYQICKAFRCGESGSRHNPEFTMLEWYRPGFDHFDLMDEVALLVGLLLGERTVKKLSYRDAFNGVLNEDPHSCSEQVLVQLAEQWTGYVAASDDNRDTLLDLLMSQVIEPTLGRGELTFIYDYPASQCALAKLSIDAEGVQIAERFELYVDGVELGNGYFELTDGAEQQRRFDRDLQQRADNKRPTVPIDQRLVAALNHGLPDCAGVALGIDRLLMLMAGTDTIREVIAFPADIA